MKAPSCWLAKTEKNNEQMLFADSLGSCSGPGYRLCGRYAFSYTHATQRDANPTDDNTGATDGYGDVISHKHAYSDQHAQANRNPFASSQRQRRWGDCLYL